MKTCTYIHKNQDGKVFYVGAGSYHRMFNKSLRSKEWQEMAKNGRTTELVAWWNTKEEAFSHEKLLISCFKDMGHPLVNKTSGGLGNDAERSKELKESHSKKMLGNKHRLGIPHDNEAKLKMSQARAGKPKPAHICLDCGRVVGGHSNIIKHQKANGCVGKAIL